MELLKMLAVVAGVMVLGSGWLVFSVWCAFKAWDFGKERATPLGWFLYLATVSTMLVGGIITFAHVAATLTGEI